jgi:hypothetical protein
MGGRAYNGLDFAACKVIEEQGSPLTDLVEGEWYTFQTHSQPLRRFFNKNARS